MTMGSEVNSMKVALAQMNSSSLIEQNMEIILGFIQEASSEKARLLVLPENCFCMDRYVEQKSQYQEIFLDGTVQTTVANWAKEYKIWVVIGAFPIINDVTNKPHSRMLVYNDLGELCCFYDKIHLFDVQVSADEFYNESDTYNAGSDYKIFEIDGVKFGCSICYDVRFPELYRYYALEGVDAFLIPAAFTYETGLKHWHTLLRSRAIENLSYVIAPNQSGLHDNKRKTYGHSLAYDPWGELLVEAKQDNQVIYMNINKKHLQTVRKQFPALDHISRKLIDA